MVNEFFNEFAYNPGVNRGGFLFFIDWANHNFNSAVSTADAHGPLGQTLAYFNCEVVPILKGVSEVNPTARLLLGLLNPPSGAACAGSGAKTASAARGGHAGATSATGLLGGGLGGSTFGQSHNSARRSAAAGAGGGR